MTAPVRIPTLSLVAFIESFSPVGSNRSPQIDRETHQKNRFSAEIFATKPRQAGFPCIAWPSTCFNLRVQREPYVTDSIDRQFPFRLGECKGKLRFLTGSRRSM